MVIRGNQRFLLLLFIIQDSFHGSSRCANILNFVIQKVELSLTVELLTQLFLLFRLLIQAGLNLHSQIDYLETLDR